MRWLPSWNVGDYALFLAIGESELDCLLDSLSAPPAAAASAVVRWLALSPASLLWSLTPAARSVDTPVQAPASFLELANAGGMVPGDGPHKSGGAAADAGQVLGQIRAAERARYLQYLADLPARPSPEQNRTAAQLLLAGLEFSCSGPFGPLRSWWHEQLRTFDFGLGHLPLQAELRRAAAVAETAATSPPGGTRPTRDDIRRDAARIGGLLDTARLARHNAAALHRAKLAALRQLAYGASHEINNPLAKISSRAQLLLMNETDPQRRRHLASIHTQALRAHEMICDMMLFAHPPPAACQPVAWTPFLHECLAELQQRFAGSGWVIEAGGAEIPLEKEVALDRGLLTSLLQALVQNASESRASGRVEIRSSLGADDELQVEIADDGPGVSPEQARHMFDPFFSGREAGRGLGFGLSKAWVIAGLHGGSLELLRTDSRGTTLLLRVPALAARRVGQTADAAAR